MNKKITITNTRNYDFYPPTPASKAIPDWYKEMLEYKDGIKEASDNGTSSTIKKCMPVYDAMTAGYILYTQVDIHVKQVDGFPYYNWPSENAIEFHDEMQADKHPVANGGPFPKWINPYIIKTEPGYSCLFLPPMHHPNKLFTIFPGVVDTDSYTSNVHFPFTLNDPKFKGIIPAGTPMVQVIPFKRDSFKLEFGGEKEIKESFLVYNKIRSKYFNKYKTMFWHRKEYK
jgi:hypothetical protein